MFRKKSLLLFTYQLKGVSIPPSFAKYPMVLLEVIHPGSVQDDYRTSV